MKKIALSGERGVGKYVLVDDYDYKELSGYKWHLSTKGYVVRRWNNGEFLPRESFKISMHRQIMGILHERKKQIDHIDRNKLNNTRENLRICTASQNHGNVGKTENRLSKYKGVSYKKHARKWEAYININGRKKHLGYFEIETDAALAYNRLAVELYGEFAHLNNVEER